MTAVEMFWYTAKETRGDGIKLYLKFKKWAKDNGCKRLAMIYLPCSMPDKLKQFYESEGFSLLEMHYEVTL
jgi:GNAT superfamily N-acetyltransferase